MKLLITGANGMLARAIAKLCEQEHTLFPFSASELDVTHLPSVCERVRSVEPCWIIHTAAFTRVDDAEVESDRAYQVNALGTRNIAIAAHSQGCPLLYYSSDYVFDGKTSRPYREWDQPNPLNVYGASKLAGETFIRSLCPAHLILRTSWLFGPGGPNFVLSILQKSNSTGSLRVVDDQRGSPTYTPDLAEVSLDLMRGGRRGTYHVTNSGDCTWHELAVETLRLAGSGTRLEAISTAELGAAAPRPAFSVLDNYLLRLEDEKLLRPWQQALAEYLKKESCLPPQGSKTRPIRD